MKAFKPALLLLVALTLLTGVVYPAVVTGLAQLLFRHQANGSLIQAGGHVAGSELIGQDFSSPRYFWSRPSATAPMPYNAASSGATNLGPTNPALLDAVGKRVTALRTAHPNAQGMVPGDLATSSASGLDPHISPASAYWQIGRVAAARGLAEADVRRLVDAHVEERQLGVLGEARVNVLLLNLALDKVAFSR